jgi:hypothetical protein
MNTGPPDSVSSATPSASSQFACHVGSDPSLVVNSIVRKWYSDSELKVVTNRTSNRARISLPGTEICRAPPGQIRVEIV